MGLDGGTYVTRSDVLRGASWALSTADTSRSSRGGNVQAGTVFKRRRLDPRAEKCVFPHLLTLMPPETCRRCGV